MHHRMRSRYALGARLRRCIWWVRMLHVARLAKVDARGRLPPTAESGYPGWGSSITGSPVTCPQNLASADGSAQSNVMLQMVELTAFLHVVSGACR